ncbi:hypothetical protein [Photobacterium ganghwense]|uniref:hypothetical protein n=1 Tax=Photobacterium ganghwense TaxID=320778 RepID=UPI0039EF7AB2
MTAEVAVYNKAAIALAADSASTISNGRTEKTYNNAEKLFSLTKHHPVGIMVYGSSELYEIPWELIIKSYRKNLKDACYDTLEEYIQDFMAFIPTFFNQLPLDDKRTYLNHLVIDYFCQIQERAEEDSDDEENSLDLEEKTKAYIAMANTLYTYLIDSEVPFLIGMSEDDIPEAKSLLKPMVLELVDKLELTDDVNSETISEFLNALVDFCSLAFLKKNNIETNRTGLVFAGYGDKEYLPQIQTYEVLGFMDDQLRYSPLYEKFAGQGEIGIIPFAQQAEVQIFMQGISNPIKTMYDEFFKQFSENTLKEIILMLNSIDSLTDDQRLKFLTTIAESMSSKIKVQGDMIKQYVQETHIDKIVDMIQHLPKNELAYMAESLVNLTAFKRKVSNDNETVGGPIDVAVISKGDGFVWVKRKHYFPSEINKHYSAL